MLSSRADRVTLGVTAVGHQEKCPWESRFVQSQKPWPSYAKSLSVVAVRLRKTKTAPSKGFSANACRQTAASPCRVDARISPRAPHRTRRADFPQRALHDA